MGGKEEWNRRRLRPRELPAYRIDSMPLVAVSREQEGAHGRQPPGQHYVYPTSEHQRRSCSYLRLHSGSDPARALYGRLLLLSRGQLSTSCPAGSGCAREVTVLTLFACVPGDLGIYLGFSCE